MRNGEQQTSEANRGKRSNQINYFIGLSLLEGSRLDVLAHEQINVLPPFSGYSLHGHREP